MQLLVLGLLLLFQSVRSEVRLHSVAGEVGRGNFTYYSLMYEGPISLILHTHAGDCDLYVSQYNSKPTYEAQSYCLHSSTCGLDRVDIPENFKRPVGVGVYGHPSHEVSEYLLEVLLERGSEIDESRFLYDSSAPVEGSQEEQSLLWGIVVSVAELLLESLLL